MFMQFHAIWAILAISGPISTYWVSKCMTTSWKIQWWYFHILSLTSSAISRNLHTISRNFGYFSPFWPIFNMFGIIKHVLELKNSLVVYHIYAKVNMVSSKVEAKVKVWVSFCWTWPRLSDCNSHKNINKYFFP